MTVSSRMSLSLERRTRVAPGDSSLRVSDELVGEEGEALTSDLRIDEKHGFLVAGLAEETLAVPSTTGKTNSRSSSTRSCSISVRPS